jgi:glyoxylase-like metal-dependent hydrolase (beta-lactamase superfamily II)
MTSTIPKSSSTVKVSIIDTGARIINIDISTFIEPKVDGFTHMTCPAYSFLIEHSSGKKYLFDLAIRKDLENMPPINLQLPKMFGWDVKVPSDVRDKLEEHGVKPEEVGGTIWSHWHWDHTGDPNRFPPSTELVVGPGFKEHMMPGYPTNPEAGFSEDAYANRSLREIPFDKSDLTIAGFRAFDFFGDGSFYLLDSFGHTIGHLCGLARTTPDTFILMGGDACHHPGLFRPSEQRPLPDEITPNPLTGSYDLPCPGALFEQVHPAHKGNEPFHTFPDVPDGKGVNHSREGALNSREKLMSLDASDDVFTVIAHDASVLDVVEFFPATSNDWKEKGWGKAARWKFLECYKAGVKQ